MERLLHYVWKYKLYASTPLTTTEGLPIAVIDPGIQNTDAGPDFFNAKIKIDGTVWAGSHRRGHTAIIGIFRRRAVGAYPQGHAYGRRYQ